MASDQVWLAVGAGILFVVIVLVLLIGSETSHTTGTIVPASTIVTSQSILNPYGQVRYVLESPMISADLEQILTYMLERGAYIDTGEPFSDDVVTALKEASRWNLSSTAPPTWYFHSYDNLHNYQLIWSLQYQSWIIKPAL